MTSEAGPSNTGFGSTVDDSQNETNPRFSHESISTEEDECRYKYVICETVIRNNEEQNVDDNVILEERSSDSSFGAMHDNISDDDFIEIDLRDVFNDLTSVASRYVNDEPNFRTRHNVSEDSNFNAHHDVSDESSIIPHGDVRDESIIIPRGDVRDDSIIIPRGDVRNNPVVIAHGGNNFYCSIRFWFFIIIILLLLASLVTFLYFIIFPPHLDLQNISTDINSFSTTDIKMPFNGTFLLALYNPHSAISFDVHQAVVSLDFDHGGHISKKIPPMSFKAHDQKLIEVDFFEKNLGFNRELYLKHSFAHDKYMFNLTIDTRMKVYLDMFRISYPRHVVQQCTNIVKGHPHPSLEGYFCRYL